MPAAGSVSLLIKGAEEVGVGAGAEAVFDLNVHIPFFASYYSIDLCNSS
jgi:hypothetical protein